MATTKIFYVAGAKGKAAVSGAYIPNDLTADSEPDFDNWGWDDYWSCEAFRRWHELNVTKYGKEVAKSKFLAAYEVAFSFGSYHQDCCYNSDFREYFKSYDIDVDTLFCSLVMPVIDTTGNVLTTAGNVSSGVANTSSLLKYLLPVALVVAGVYAVDRWVYPIFPDKNKRP